MVHCHATAQTQCPEVPLSAVFSLFFSHFDIKAGGKSTEDIVERSVSFMSVVISLACQPILYVPLKYNVDEYINALARRIATRLSVQDQGPVSQEIPTPIWRNFRNNYGTAGY